MTISQSTKLTGATKNYRFGQKNNWRRTVWNEVLRRTAGREKTEPILYLAGPDDFDRAIATDKGVAHQNLISVDRDIRNVDRVRAARHPVLNGDLQDVLASWPASRRVCAVLMDFCCGLTMPAVDVYDLLEREPFRDAVVMINLQRGRDAWSNKLRFEIGGGVDQDDTVFDWAWAVSSWAYGPDQWAHVDRKHRAMAWLVYHAMDAWRATVPSLLNAIQATPGYEDGFEEAAGLMWSGNYFKSADPRFYSYKSGFVNFDSVVCWHPLGRALAVQSDEDVRAKTAIVEAHHAHRRSPEMARKITAMLAVRTRRS